MTIDEARARARNMSPVEIKEVCSLPSDFGWQDPADEEGEEGTWTLGPLVDMRDSDPLLQANGQTMVAVMTELFGSEGIEAGWQITRCRHWGWGWVEHLSCRALDAEGMPTPQIGALLAMADRMADYPILDEDLYSRLNLESQLEDITHLLPYGGYPEDMDLLDVAGQIWDVLWSSGDLDGEGIPEEGIRQACRELWPDLWCPVCGGILNDCEGCPE